MPAGPAVVQSKAGDPVSHYHILTRPPPTMRSPIPCRQAPSAARRYCVCVFGRIRAGPGRFRAKFGRNRAKFGRRQTKFCRNLEHMVWAERRGRALNVSLSRRASWFTRRSSWPRHTSRCPCQYHVQREATQRTSENNAAISTLKHLEQVAIPCISPPAGPPPYRSSMLNTSGLRLNP